MNQRITTHYANIFSNARRESRELPCRKFPLIGEGRLKRDPSIDNFFGALAFFRFSTHQFSIFRKTRPVYTHDYKMVTSSRLDSRALVRQTDFSSTDRHRETLLL